MEGQPPLIKVGARFNSKKDLKEACQASATRENFEYRVDKSDRSRMTLKCLAPECPWRLHASRVVDGESPCFEVKTMHAQHTCLGIHHLGHRQASAKFISSQIQAKINDQPSYRPKDIVKDIRRENGIHMSYKQAHRAKFEALNAINGTEEEAYAAMPKYCEDLRHNNPGSTIELECHEVEGGSRFYRVFICYGASAIGFAVCCLVLGLDGTHLTSKYRGAIIIFFVTNSSGILLTATASDANGSLFPLAYAVVDAENDNNWHWFNQLLRNVIQQHAPAFLVPRTLTFVSDRQKGILESVERHFPDSPHSYCLRHLYDNMHKQFKHPQLKTFLWQAAKAI